MDETRPRDKALNEATRIKAPTIPVELRPGLTVYLKFTMLSSHAMETRFGTSNAIAVLFGMTSATSTDWLAFLLGAAMLHKGPAVAADEDDEDWQELVPDLKGIKVNTVSPADEAARIGRTAMVLFDQETLDVTELILAVVRASDISRPIAPCDRCRHALGSHGWFKPCTAEGCECGGYTRRCEKCPHFLVEHSGKTGKCTLCACAPVVAEGKAEAPASTGASSGTPPPSASAVVTGASG